MEPDLTRLPSFSTYASAQESCPHCAGVGFDWATSGDGGLLQVCDACGVAWGIGRFYIDKAIGPRWESTWSAGGAR